MAGIANTQSIADVRTPAQRPQVSALPAPFRSIPATPGQITVDDVLKVTAEHFGMTPEVLISHRRTRSLIRYRQVAMYVAREMTGRGLSVIGRRMDNRHHTTILHGARVIMELLEARDAKTVAAVSAIKQRLSSRAELIPAMPARIKVHHVIKVTAAHFGTTPEELVSDRMTKPLIRYRQVAMYVAREMTGRGVRVIGYYMGKRDHRAILYGARTIKGLLDAGDTATTAAVSAIKQRLQILRTASQTRATSPLPPDIRISDARLPATYEQATAAHSVLANR